MLAIAERTPPAVSTHEPFSSQESSDGLTCVGIVLDEQDP